MYMQNLVSFISPLPHPIFFTAYKYGFFFLKNSSESCGDKSSAVVGKEKDGVQQFASPVVTGSGTSTGIKVSLQQATCAVAYSYSCRLFV